MVALREAIKLATAALSANGFDLGVIKAGSLRGESLALVVFASESAVRFAESLGYSFNDDPGLPPSVLVNCQEEVTGLVTNARAQGLTVDSPT